MESKSRSHESVLRSIWICQLDIYHQCPQRIQGTFRAPCCTPPGRLGPPPPGHPPAACETSEVAAPSLRIDPPEAGFAGLWLLGGWVFGFCGDESFGICSYCCIAWARFNKVGRAMKHKNENAFNYFALWKESKVRISSGQLLAGSVRKRCWKS